LAFRVHAPRPSCWARPFDRILYDPTVSYLVGSPKGRLTKLEKSLGKKTWEQVKDDVHVKLLEQEGELYILARSLPRRAKEGAMRQEKRKAYRARLRALQQRKTITLPAQPHPRSASRPKLCWRATPWRPFGKNKATTGFTTKPPPNRESRIRGAQRSELHQFAVIPKRWVVERSIAWMDKCRRLWKNCGRKLETSPASMRLAFIPLLLKKIKTGSKTLSWGSEAATAPHCFGFVVQ